MPLEVLTVAGTFVLAIISFNVALIALDIVEHVLMLMKKLGRILLEQFYEFIEFGLTLQQWMLIQKLAGIVVRLQFVECLKITDAEFRHGSHIIRLRFLVQEFVEFLHLAPCIDAVVIDDGCRLHVLVIEVIPVDVRIFLFLLNYFFFESSPGSAASDCSDSC